MSYAERHDDGEWSLSPARMVDRETEEHRARLAWSVKWAAMTADERAELDAQIKADVAEWEEWRATWPKCPDCGVPVAGGGRCEVCW